AAGLIIVFDKIFGNRPIITTSDAKIAGEINISTGASLGSFGVSKLSPVNTPNNNFIEKTNVNILPTIASSGNNTLIALKKLTFDCEISNIASKNNSFDKNPLNGGSPAIENAVINVIVKLIGIIVNNAPRRLILLVPVW